MKVIMFFFILMMGSLQVTYAQLSIDSSISSRYRTYENGESIQQGGVSITLKGNLKNGYKIVSLIGTGHNFQTQWHTFYDYNNQSSNLKPTLNIRRLYIQKDFKIGHVQLGAMQPWRGIMNYSAMNRNGWVDGGRVHLDTRYGKMTVTAGSIADINNNGLLKRERKLNYFDIHMSKEVYKNLIMDVGLDNTADVLYTRSAVKWNVPLVGNRVVSFLLEEVNALNTDKPSYMINMGAEYKTNIKSLLNKELKNTFLSVTLNYGYISPHFETERQALNAYAFLYEPGHQVNAQIKLKSGSWSLFSVGQISNNSKFVIGVKKDINWTGFKKKKKGKNPPQL